MVVVMMVVVLLVLLLLLAVMVTRAELNGFACLLVLLLLARKCMGGDQSVEAVSFYLVLLNCRGVLIPLSFVAVDAATAATAMHVVWCRHLLSRQYRPLCIAHAVRLSPQIVLLLLQVVALC